MWKLGPGDRNIEAEHTTLSSIREMQFVDQRWAGRRCWQEAAPTIFRGITPPSVVAASHTTPRLGKVIVSLANSLPLALCQTLTPLIFRASTDVSRSPYRSSSAMSCNVLSSNRKRKGVLKLTIYEDLRSWSEHTRGSEVPCFRT